MLIDITCCNGVPFKECNVRVRGDQLYVDAPHYSQLHICLPFGADTACCSGHLKGGSLELTIPYAPIQNVWHPK